MREMATGFTHDIEQTDEELAIELLLMRDTGPGEYLTDDVCLYRLVGRCGSGPAEMVAVEDCYSLELMLLPAADIARAGLRTVEPVSVHC